jgi:hypothetical protein
MLKNNILASSYIFLSVAHNRLVLKKYFKILNEIFKEISIFESGKNLETLEKIPESHTGFKRLN